MRTLRSVEGASFEHALSDDGVTVALSGDTPILGTGVLGQLMRLATIHGITLRLNRPDGSSISFDREGNESRVPGSSSLDTPLPAIGEAAATDIPGQVETETLRS